MIPKFLHFCFGLSSKGGDWGLVHYACVKSAVERIRPEQAVLYFEYRPEGPFWDLTTRIIECQKITAPRYVFGNRLVHYAHRADVLRLEKLIAVGGIYLDCDVFVHRDFDDFLDNSVVLGREGELGLCNAVMLAEPGAPFLRRWYSRYTSFRSKGHDLFWNEHSVKLPLKLAQTHPEELTILGPRAFFWPIGDDQGLRRIFASDEPIPGEGVYATHLWESRAWSDYLRDLTPGRVKLINSNFHYWVRPLVADLSDNFGAPPLAMRLISRIRATELRKMSESPRQNDGPRQIFTAIEGTLRRNKRVRRIFTTLRTRHSFIDRAIRKRHVFINRTLGMMAGLAAKGWGSNVIGNLHRRRTFQSIYRDCAWGEDSRSRFYSGPGSRGEHAQLYVSTMVPLIARHAGELPGELVVVDLGCGDFAVGSQLLKSLPGVRYIGCDIVPELIEHNQWCYGIAEAIEFRQIDIVCDPLPDGHVCLVRQVLQHLSNAEIATVLRKLAKYEYVYITEHQPLTPEGAPNPDKQVGQDIRFDWRTGCGRGVEVNFPPWNLTTQEVIRTISQDVKGSIVTNRIISFDPKPVRQMHYPSNPPDYLSTVLRGAGAFLSCVVLRKGLVQQLSLAKVRRIVHRTAGRDGILAIAGSVARRWLPELDYQALSLDALMAQIWRVRVTSDIDIVEGFLSVTDRQVLYALARSVPGPFAEIGAWVGRSTCIICAGIRDSGQQKEFVTHELGPRLEWFKPYRDGIGFFPPGAGEPFGVCSIEIFNREIRPVLERPGGAIGQLIRNLSSFGYLGMVDIKEGDFGAVEARPYNLVFADVLHDAREIASNGPRLARIVRSGTVLACHDSNDENEALLANYISFRTVRRLDSMLVAVVQ